MGIACTRPFDRVLACLGKLPGGAHTQFQPCRDFSYGGVLCALPALAENRLFRHLQTTFPTLTGYNTTLLVILLLADLALCRIRTVEQLQYASPGELGKLTFATSRRWDSIRTSPPTPPRPRTRTPRLPWRKSFAM